MVLTAATQLHAELSIWICAPDNSPFQPPLTMRHCRAKPAPICSCVMHMVASRLQRGSPISDSGKSSLPCPRRVRLDPEASLLLSPLRENDPRLTANAPLLDAVTSLVATAIERLHFVEVAHSARLEANGERLRNSIGRTVARHSHPLTALQWLWPTR